MKKWIQNEHGLALPAVLLVMTLFTILGVSALTLALNNYTTGRYELEDEAAYYIAEGGLEAATIELKKIEADVWAEADLEKDTLEDIINQVIARFQSEVGRTFQYTGSENGTPDSFQNKYGRTEAVITIRQGSADNELILRSAGTIENNNRTVERVLEKTIRVEMDPQDGTPGSGGSGGTGGGGGNEPSLPENIAVFTQSDIVLKGNAHIKGNIGLLDEEGALETNGSVSIDGSVYVPPNSTTNVPSGVPVVNYTNGISLPLPLFPAAPNPSQAADTGGFLKGGSLSLNKEAVTWSLAADTSIETLDLTKDSTLTIDTGTGDKQLVVEEFSMSDSDIELAGSGKLTIFVKDSIYFTSNGKRENIINGNTNQSDRLQIVFLGDQDVDFGNETIYGSLIVKSADLLFGDNVTIAGGVYSGATNIEFKGNSFTETPVVYAPNAHISLGGNSDVKGTLIGQSLEAKGSVTITQQPYNFDFITFPNPSPTPPAPGTGGTESYVQEDKTVEVSP